jgi:O-antigen/teichoic acid export membrane protein
MWGYLKRLARTGAAYQLAEAFAKVPALLLLPIYTRELTRADYGTAELLLTGVFLVSMVLRAGVDEAFVRFYYHDEDPERRERLARTATAFVLIVSSLVAMVGCAFAGPLSELVLGYRDTTIMLITIGGLWVFSNIELANAQLRVDERAGTYLKASFANVGLTIVLTVWLVVFEHDGARGLLGGNFLGSAIVLAGLWWVLRDRIGWRPERARLPAMLRFGAPTVPAEVSVYALNVVDRFYLFHAASPGKAGLYSLAVKLATVVVLLTRALRFAWPPLAYSVSDEREARRLYALVATYYVLLAGLVVAGATLLGRWVLKVFAASNFYAAFPALPWVSLGWALYGVFVMLVVVAGRAQRTSRNFPAAFAGLVANIVLLVVLVGPLGIAGAGIALCGAYVVMIVVMHLLTRRLFPVPFEWRRLAQVVVVIAAVTVAGELLLPTDGVAAFLERAAALLAIPVLLAATGFFDAAERSRLRALARRLRGGARPAEPAEV